MPKSACATAVNVTANARDIQIATNAFILLSLIMVDRSYRAAVRVALTTTGVPNAGRNDTRSAALTRWPACRSARCFLFSGTLRWYTPDFEVECLVVVNLSPEAVINPDPDTVTVRWRTDPSKLAVANASLALVGGAIVGLPRVRCGLGAGVAMAGPGPAWRQSSPMHGPRSIGANWDASPPPIRAS